MNAAVKTAPFDLEAAKRGEAICQRDGGSAKFLQHVPEANEEYRVVFLSDVKDVLVVDESGIWSRGHEGRRDLCMVVKTKTVWLNVYPAALGGYAVAVFAREADADAARGSERRVACQACVVSV